MWPAFYALQRIHHPISNCGPAVRVVRIGSVQVAISNNLKSSLFIFFSCLRERESHSLISISSRATISSIPRFVCSFALSVSLFFSLSHPCKFCHAKGHFVCRKAVCTIVKCTSSEVSHHKQTEQPKTKRNSSNSLALIND